MNNKPQRKPNRLKDFDYSQAGAYFVTICVQHREPILGTITKTRTPSVGVDAHIDPCPTSDPAACYQTTNTLSQYGVVAEKYIKGIRGIDKYVVMPNHIHLIIMIQPVSDGSMWASTPTQSIPQLISSFKQLVTKELGCPIFQRSYHDHIIRNEQEYRMIWRYIDENPLKWTQDCFYPAEPE